MPVRINKAGENDIFFSFFSHAISEHLIIHFLYQIVHKLFKPNQLFLKEKIDKTEKDS